MTKFKAGGLFIAAFVFLALVFQRGEARADFLFAPLPQFSSSNQKDWINSKPLEKSDLKGNVTLVYFWTFDCWNSYRSFPWLLKLEKEFASKGLRIVGVHTPEFEHEKVRRNLEAKMREFKITHPVMMDNGFKYWRKMHNRYWPAFYLTDREGNIVYRMVGETHIGRRNAKQFEGVVAELVKR